MVHVGAAPPRRGVERVPVVTTQLPHWASAAEGRSLLALALVVGEPEVAVGPLLARRTAAGAGKVLERVTEPPTGM